MSVARDFVKETRTRQMDDLCHHVKNILRANCYTLEKGKGVEVTIPQGTDAGTIASAIAKLEHDGWNVAHSQEKNRLFVEVGPPRSIGRVLLDWLWPEGGTDG